MKNDIKYSDDGTKLNKVDRYYVGELVIKEGVTEICDEAFFLCSHITSIKIPYGVTRIGNCAFDSCRSLETISIPSSVQYVGTAAFLRCSNLKTIRIPKGCTQKFSSLDNISKVQSLFIECDELQ